MFGSIIGKIFEWFYNNRIWAGPNVLLNVMALIPKAMDRIFQHEKFDPLSDTWYVDNIKYELEQLVPHALEVIRKYHLISPNSVAELDLTQLYYSAEHNLTVKFGGKSDFIHYDRGVSILDGKASKHRELYSDTNQLIWYALLHYLKFRVAPSRIGFIYWRFPKDALQWVDYDAQSLRKLRNRTLTTVQNILNKKFDPTPSAACKLCSYNQTCQPGIKYLADHRVASVNRVESSVFDIELM
jgi:CRISPR/Cas system-associated exonuclease Cas4 (RecB family)